MMNLSKNVRIEQVITPTAGAAGTSDITATEVDMEGFEGCLFIVQTGAITSGAVTSLKVRQSSTSGSGYSDLEGTSQTIADTDDEDLFYVDIYKPRERYLSLLVDRGTQNAVIANAIAIKYGTRKMPTTHGSVVNGETHVSPAEGTA